MRLKKVMATGLVAALALSTMVGCSSKKDSSDQKKIGVVQLVEHDALDASYKGFKDGLEKAGYKDGDKIKIEYKNAQNEQSNCQTIAKQFVTDRKRMKEFGKSFILFCIEIKKYAYKIIDIRLYGI